MVQQMLKDTLYNNSSQILYRHIIYDAETNTITNKGDTLFKKGDYIHTYIGVVTEGIPNGVILNLVDEESNLLYSPVDTNGNWITTQCSIIVGEQDIIQLPAQFNDDLSSFTPFNSGIYNWKLKFFGNDDFNGIEIPFTVTIQDFNYLTCKPIYASEDLKVQLRTPANTYYPSNEVNKFLTPNAFYDEETGIITYPNQDLISTDVGKHTQIINQKINYAIDYEIKNAHTYISDLDIDAQGNLLVSQYSGNYNDIETVSEIDIEEDANLYITKDINEDESIIINDIDIDENGDLIYTKINDI